MKVKVYDYKESGFGIDLKPENIEEAGILVRMGLNARTELHSLETQVFSDYSFSTWIRIAGFKEQKSTVGRKR